MAKQEPTAEDIRRLYGGLSVEALKADRPLRLSDVLAGAGPKTATVGLVCRCGAGLWAAAFERGQGGQWALHLTCMNCRQTALVAVEP